MKHIPNLFTLLNLVFGCLAIIAILQNGIAIQYTDDGAQFVDIPESVMMASVFIGCAALVDFLDGFVARLFNATSELGKQLDSLADVVSFGVAPALILYQLLRMSYAREENGIEVSTLYLLPALLFAVAAAYRLGKFNVDTEQTTGFKGVPTPAAGLMIAAFPLIYWHPANQWLALLLVNKWFIYGVIIMVSWLMVSNIPMLALKFTGRSMKSLLPFILLLVIGVASFIFLQWAAVPVMFIAYIILSLLFKNRS